MEPDGQPTQLSARQINLRDIFSVKNILTSRGFEIKKEGDFSDLLLPSLDGRMRYGKALFKIFDSAELRAKILTYIRTQVYNNDDAAINELIESGLIKDEQTFTRTFEWYVGELMINRFAAFASSYGVDVKELVSTSTEKSPGDYDALSVMRNLSLMYFECKTGNYDRWDIKKTLKRSLRLHCQSSVIFEMNRIEENILKEKICKIDKHPLINTVNLRKIKCKGIEQSFVYEWGNCFFCDGIADITNQLKIILRIIEARRNFDVYTSDLDNEGYDVLGYEVEEIKD